MGGGLCGVSVGNYEIDIDISHCSLDRVWCRCVKWWKRVKLNDSKLSLRLPTYHHVIKHDRIDNAVNSTNISINL